MSEGMREGMSELIVIRGKSIVYGNEDGEIRWMLRELGFKKGWRRNGMDGRGRGWIDRLGFPLK